MEYMYLKIWNKDHTKVIFAMANIKVKKDGEFYFFYTLCEDRYVGICRIEDVEIEGESFE